MTEIDPTATLHAFDAFLAHEGREFSGVVIGGAALHALGYITRSTDDVDVLIPQIPEVIADAAARFASLPDTAPTEGSWLNSKSYDFVGVPGCLPSGWEQRLRPLFRGQALDLQTLGRQDLLCTKLVALVAGTDLSCRLLGRAGTRSDDDGGSARAPGRLHLPRCPPRGAGPQGDGSSGRSVGKGNPAARAGV